MYYALVGGVAAQMAAVMDGVSALLPLTALAPFSAAELEIIVCGDVETWDPQSTRLCDVLVT